MPRVAIEYCTQCRWLLRASWMAQELLTTFATDLSEVALIPGEGGVFRITVDRSGSVRVGVVARAVPSRVPPVGPPAATAVRSRWHAGSCAPWVPV
ncbi:SelT/SelW/SelH family protein [Nocardia sp. NPDC046763]|uniref:SelT/SelW/SelH family protein n=1 Tax=Nocardia sp. NPDC046763 TaxID=3155256 RepID=UPI0033C5A81A